MGLLITFILGIFIFIGVLVIKLTNNSKIIEQLSISIALGTMLSLISTELIPEVFEIFKSNNIIITLSLILSLVIVGILLLKLLDKFIPEHDSEHGLSHDCTKQNLVHIGIVSSIAIVLHNIIEGMAVYNITLESTKVGILMALSIGLHNIPMGMIIYSTIEKENKNKKIILLSLVGLSTFIGGLLMLFISSILNDIIIGILMCITIGMIIYIIIFELIPHLLHNKNKILSIFGIIIGILIIFISMLFE